MPQSTKSDDRRTAPRQPSGVTFQTRARTIDHLGRGQIADAPTAVSELWKNAYDAYAKDVALHIFDGSPEVALVVDDGAGMSLTTFQDRWLVIGTELKIEDSDAEPVETFGLEGRVRQGEKGIGRLSAAFLAPVTLVVSKTVRDHFAAALVDWRLFENPFLLIQDIRIPIVEFDEPTDLANVLKKMADIIRSNFGVSAAEARRDPDFKGRALVQRMAQVHRVRAQPKCRGCHSRRPRRFLVVASAYRATALRRMAGLRGLVVARYRTLSCRRSSRLGAVGATGSSGR